MGIDIACLPPFALQGLALFSGGVLMVSHDQHLIESTVDELWAVENGRGAFFNCGRGCFKRLIFYMLHECLLFTTPLPQ